jgi:transcriptional regulator GlxA family with amidase domain
MDLLQWIIRLSPKVRRLRSICSGAFLLAESGLLDGRRATTHWAHVKEFGARFPEVLLDADLIWLRDGNIYTSAGVISGMAFLHQPAPHLDHQSPIRRARCLLLAGNH